MNMHVSYISWSLILCLTCLIACKQDSNTTKSSEYYFVLPNGVHQDNVSVRELEKKYELLSFSQYSIRHSYTDSFFQGMKVKTYSLKNHDSITKMAKKGFKISQFLKEKLRNEMIERIEFTYVFDIGAEATQREQLLSYLGRSYGKYVKIERAGKMGKYVFEDKYGQIVCKLDLEYHQVFDPHTYVIITLYPIRKTINADQAKANMKYRDSAVKITGKYFQYMNARKFDSAATLFSNYFMKNNQLDIDGDFNNIYKITGKSNIPTSTRYKAIKNLNKKNAIGVEYEIYYDSTQLYTVQEFWFFFDDNFQPQIDSIAFDLW